VTVWTALSKYGFISPFSLEDQDEHEETINGERYLCILIKKCIPVLCRKGFILLDNTWFQQDGATPHTSAAVLDWLDRTFEDRVVSLKTQYAWPPHSPDLSPLDFYLWGFLKDQVYKTSPTTLKELKTNIRREIRGINHETCKAVIDNFKRRCDVVIEQNGRHVEHVL
jgi:hypothetical protein